MNNRRDQPAQLATTETGRDDMTRYAITATHPNPAAPQPRYMDIEADGEKDARARAARHFPGYRLYLDPYCGVCGVVDDDKDGCLCVVGGEI